MSTQPTERAGGRAIGRTWEGVLLMVFTCACFAGMSAAIRHISAEISVFQIAFIRNGIGTLILVPFMFRVGFGSFELGRFRLFAVRAVIGVCAMWAWYSALQITPLAEAITLNFTVSLWMIPVAILMLGERVGPAPLGRHRRWLRRRADCPATGRRDRLRRRPARDLRRRCSSPSRWRWCECSRARNRRLPSSST